MNLCRDAGGPNGGIGCENQAVYCRDCVALIVKERLAAMETTRNVLEDHVNSLEAVAAGVAKERDAAVRERDEARAALKEIGHCELLCHCCKATLDAAIGGQA